MDDLNLSIRWPGGNTETFSGLKAGAHYTIVQDEGRPRLSSTASPALPKISSHARHDPDSDTSSRNGFWVANQVPFPCWSVLTNKVLPARRQTFLASPC